MTGKAIIKDGKILMGSKGLGIRAVYEYLKI
jgi:hypothetical protein